MHIGNMHYRSLTPGDYLTAAEIQGLPPPTLTISKIEMHPFDKTFGKQKEEGKEGKEDAKRYRGVIYFKETKLPRGWVLNSTNAQCLARLFGDLVSGWIGKRVTLCAEQVSVGPNQELGIRVKGSPDIAAPMEVEIKLFRKRPFKRTLLPTPIAGRGTD